MFSLSTCVSFFLLHIYFVLSDGIYAEQIFNRSTEVESSFHGDSNKDNDSITTDHMFAENSTEVVSNFLRTEEDDSITSSAHMNEENSRTEIEDKNEEDYAYGCENMEEPLYKDENYNFVKNFQERFSKLIKQNRFELPYENGKIKAVYFLGNTSFGKSTAVQILTKNYKNLYSKEANPGTVNCIRADGTQIINKNTVNSQTLFPEFSITNETSYLMCDCPGFGDTRSQIHELITTYYMRKALQNTSKVKVAIVVTHAALIPGNFRTDFLDALTHVSEMFRDVEKYKNSFYLICVKAENKMKWVGGQMVMLSDQNITTAIGYFLLEVKHSLNGDINITYAAKERKKLVTIIDNLLKKKDNKTFDRISIIRKPIEGPLSNINFIQKEIIKIRKVLLNDDNMVTADEYDFGFPLSGKAIINLNELFQKMNAYMSVLADIISKHIEKHYESLIDSNADFNVTINRLQEMQENFTTLTNDIKTSKNPRNFVEKINDFSQKSKLLLYCLYNYSDITTIHDYLTYLDNYSETAKYLPSSWEIRESEISQQINTKLVQYDFLAYIFELLTSHTIQMQYKENMRNLKTNEDEFTVNKESIPTFLEKYKLKLRYRNMVIDDTLIKQLNDILKLTLKHELNVVCSNETLILSDFIILLSQIENDTYKLCNNTKEIVMLASHTIYLDRNLTDDWFKGISFTIISPVWEVVGLRRISLDGMSFDGYKLPRANVGEIGIQGLHGKPGGSFTGIGMKFIDGANLEITANGGNGQDGQDGGNGGNYRQGSDGTYESKEKYGDRSWTATVLFNQYTDEYIARASEGTPGGDSGAGGKPGFGGRSGSFTLYEIDEESNGIKFYARSGVSGKDGSDGSPGIGGNRGCDLNIKQKRFYFLFIPLPLRNEKEYINCRGAARNGQVRTSNNQYSTRNYSEITKCSNCKICENISAFKLFINTNMNQSISDGMTKKFISGMKLKEDLKHCFH